MEPKIKILDCTLRDGGYYNNWDFSDSLYALYLKSMQNLPVDIIEIGYRSTPRKDYFGKFFYCPEYLLEECKRLAPSKQVSLMLNERDISVESIDGLLAGIKGYVDMIRLAVDPKRFDSALKLAAKIKETGIKVGFNLMYMSELVKDKGIIKSLSALNGRIDYFSLVDSFGGVYPSEITDIVKMVKEILNIPLGFHGHNNIEMALANSLSAIDAGCEMIDSTVCGMGRGAGNLKTELLFTVLNRKINLNVDYNALSEVVSAFSDLQKQYGWGTNLPYMVSGVNSLPQKDVMDWVTKRFYSFNGIIQALNNQKTGIEDNLKLPVFKPTRKYKQALIIGGGESAFVHAKGIKEFIKRQKDLCLVHASSKNAKYYDDTDVDSFFCLVGNEGYRMENVFGHLDVFSGCCVLPPYPRKMGTYVPSKVKDKSFELSQITFTDKYLDSHTVLALQTAIELGAEKIYVAGYDGYNNMVITAKEHDLIIENEYSFEKVSSAVTIQSLLPTQYSLEVCSLYSFLS